FTSASPASTYTLSLHDALPILFDHRDIAGCAEHEEAGNARGQKIQSAKADLSIRHQERHHIQADAGPHGDHGETEIARESAERRDRKSTRLNSSTFDLVCRLLL